MYRSQKTQSTVSPDTIYFTDIRIAEESMNSQRLQGTVGNGSNKHFELHGEKFSDGLSHHSIFGAKHPGLIRNASG